MVKSFSIILFRAAMVFGEEVNRHQGHGALFQAHDLLLDLTNLFSCTFTPSPVTSPATGSLNEESGEWPHDRFGTDLIQISSVAFHTFLGQIIVLFSYHASQVCELLHLNVHTTSDVHLPGQSRLGDKIWGYACPHYWLTRCITC